MQQDIAKAAIRADLIKTVSAAVGKVAWAISVPVSLYVIAGTTTYFETIGNWSLSIDKGAAAVILGLFGYVGWGAERKFRKKEIAELSEKNRQLELQVDPARSTSGLGADGLPKVKVIEADFRPDPKKLKDGSS